jgi:hypothetical protein
MQADVNFPKNSVTFPDGAKADSVEACCDICASDPDCRAGAVFSSPADTVNCWPLQGYGGVTPNASRTFIPVTNPQQNIDALDLYVTALSSVFFLTLFRYGFFHGRDFRAAIADFVAVSGRTMMVRLALPSLYYCNNVSTRPFLCVCVRLSGQVPRWASGVWWSRWFDLSNADVLATVRMHDDMAIPLDVFVLDMNWHQKNDWTGFTFDAHLFPYLTRAIRSRIENL